ATQDFSRPEQMLLTDEFTERPGPHFLGEGLGGVLRFVGRSGEEIHSIMLAQPVGRIEVRSPIAFFKCTTMLS
ncbi:MAG TPA: hypothetical protein VNT76_14170, partial [Candidatus Binatus sp.]|nr:hypothetical protein [Candidatus Binatus sp.]